MKLDQFKSGYYRLVQVISGKLLLGHQSQVISCYISLGQLRSE